METTETSVPLTARAQRWADEQAQFEASGLSVLEFCRRHKLGTSTFYKRRALLRELGYQGLRMDRPSKAKPQTSETSVGFVDAGVLEPVRRVPTLGADTKVASAVPATPSSGLHEEGTATNGSVEVRIDLGLGVVLTIVRH